MSDKNSSRREGIGLLSFLSACVRILAKPKVLTQIGQPAINETTFEPMKIIASQAEPEVPCDGTLSAYSGRRHGTLPGAETSRISEFDGLVD